MAECAAGMFEGLWDDEKTGVSVVLVLPCRFCPEELILP